MFKKFLNPFKSETVDNSFIKGFFGTVNLFLIENNKKEFLGENC